MVLDTLMQSKQLLPLRLKFVRVLYLVVLENSSQRLLTKLK